MASFMANLWILSMFFLSCLGSVPICKRWAKLWSSPQLTLDWGHAWHLSNSGFPIEAAKHRWIIDVHLVGGFNLPLWKIWVSWDDEIPNTVYGKIIQMFQTTNQIYIYNYLPPGREISIFNQTFYKSSDPDMNRPMKNLYGNNLDLNCQQTTMRTWTQANKVCICTYNIYIYVLYMYINMK